MLLNIFSFSSPALPSHTVSWHSPASIVVVQKGVYIFAIVK